LVSGDRVVVYGSFNTPAGTFLPGRCEVDPLRYLDRGQASAAADFAVAASWSRAAR
jgi:hypothetical protein